MIAASHIWILTFILELIKIFKILVLQSYQLATIRHWLVATILNGADNMPTITESLREYPSR